jgi:hypothetical protein
MAEHSPGQSRDPSRDGGATTGHGTAPEPDKKSLLRSRLVAGLWGFLLAAVPVVGVVITTWFQAHWDPPDKSVSLGAVCLESGVTHGYFWSLYHEKVADPTLQGLEVTVALTANGFDGANIYIRSDVLNTVSGAEALGSLQDMAELRPVPISASTVMRDPQIWVPLPTTPGKYAVQVRVMDGDLPSGNQGLASAYSSIFTLGSGGRITLSGVCS